MNRTRDAAGLLIASHRSGRPFVAGDDPAPHTVEDAYAVQSIVLDALEPGRRPVAWKVSPPKDGQEPVASPLPRARVLDSGASLPSGGLRLFGIECEIAFRMSRDLPEREGPYEMPELVEAVAEATAAIELCESRMDNWRETSALWRLADFQLNGALVVGRGIGLWSARDWNAQEVELWIDGALRARARGSHPCGDPATLLAPLATHCARRTGGLRAGDLVTTGSWTGMTLAAPGAIVRAVFPGVGVCELRIQP